MQAIATEVRIDKGAAPELPPALSNRRKVSDWTTLSGSKASNARAMPRLQRLIKLLFLLHSGLPRNTAQLSELLHVSRRTTFRDLQILKDAKVPLVFDSEQGIYRLNKTFCCTALEREELAVLLISTHSIADSLPPKWKQRLNNALTKLLCACSEASRTSANRDLNQVESILTATNLFREAKVIAALGYLDSHSPAKNKPTDR